MRTITITFTVPDDVGVEVKTEYEQAAWLKEWKSDVQDLRRKTDLSERVYHCLLYPVRLAYMQRNSDRPYAAPYSQLNRIPHNFSVAARRLISGKLHFRGLGPKGLEELKVAMDRYECKRYVPPYRRPGEQPYQRPEPRG